MKTEPALIIFVASLSASLQERILKWEKGFKFLPVRWLSGKNLHLTIVPPWYEDDIEGSRDKLRDLAGKFRQMDLNFTQVEFGPTMRQPRLIWVRGEVNKELIALKEAVDRAFKKNSPKRQFIPHFTLARFRSEDFVDFKIKELDETVFWINKASSIVIMQAHLSPKGADYEIIEAINL